MYFLQKYLTSGQKAQFIVGLPLAICQSIVFSPVCTAQIAESWAVSGDIAVSAWQYYSATGNLSWLEVRRPVCMRRWAFRRACRLRQNTGFPILAGTADFMLARVSPAPPPDAALAADTAYHISGILPIDGSFALLFR